MGADAEATWNVSGQGDITVAKLDRLEFGENYLELVSLQDGSSQVVIYRIDPTASPKTIDVFDQGQGGTPGETFALGNYEVKGDKLTMRLARFLRTVQGNQRPSGVEGKPASGDVVLSLERYRPSKEERAFLGNWAVAGLIEDGKAADEQRLRSMKATFDTYFYCGDRDAMARLMLGVWRLDAGRQPKTITLFQVITTAQTEQFVGIYKLETNRLTSIPLDGNNLPETLKSKRVYKHDADRLTIAFRKGDKPPEKFESKPGSGVTLLTLERPKARPTSDKNAGVSFQPGGTRADDGADVYYPTTPLAKAVRKFNFQAALDRVGKKEPVLTVDEVIAAVKSALEKPEKLGISGISDETLQAPQTRCRVQQASDGERI